MMSIESMDEAAHEEPQDEYEALRDRARAAASRVRPGSTPTHSRRGEVPPVDPRAVTSPRFDRLDEDPSTPEPADPLRPADTTSPSDITPQRRGWRDAARGLFGRGRPSHPSEPSSPRSPRETPSPAISWGRPTGTWDYRAGGGAGPSAGNEVSTRTTITDSEVDSLLWEEPTEAEREEELADEVVREGERRGIRIPRPNVLKAIRSGWVRLDNTRILGKPATDFLVGMGVGVVARVAINTITGGIGAVALGGGVGAIKAGVQEYRTQRREMGRLLSEAESDEARTELKAKLKINRRRLGLVVLRGAVMGAAGAYVGHELADSLLNWDMPNLKPDIHLPHISNPFGGSEDQVVPAGADHVDSGGTVEPPKETAPALASRPDIVRDDYSVRPGEQTVVISNPDQVVDIKLPDGAHLIGTPQQIQDQLNEMRAAAGAPGAGITEHLPGVNSAFPDLDPRVGNLTELEVKFGSNPWNETKAMLQTALGHDIPNDDPRILEVTKLIAKDSGIKVPGWGLTEGTVDQHSIPPGFKMVVSDKTKSVIQDMVRKG